MQVEGRKVTIHAADLDGFLKEEDKKKIDYVKELYEKSLDACSKIENSSDLNVIKNAEEQLVETSSQIGDYLEQVTAAESRIHVYCFESPTEQHGEASRLIAKLRDPKTGHEEFLYYIQRAYELLFSHVFADSVLPRKRSIITKTPVTNPCRNYAVHKIPDVDSIIKDSVMCVMLRGALLPSMIISKEIQDYSSDDFVTPFALFKIKRDETKKEDNMAYVLDLDRSFFDFKELDGKDLIFADPMNATGGSLVTIVQYLKDNGVKPRSIKFINVISALKGAVRIIRAIPECEVYTLWMDPVLNDAAYILPGLGDAGDRLNGEDLPGNPRNMIQLIADYGSTITNLYRAQVKKIEDTVLN
ncbi:MAG: uracil phosphoribosyltransferase [Sphaerochaetaceae bacterium]|nr:uracil phosphoribosyltransferase [Sphaerochaetaceae bacterium]